MGVWMDGCLHPVQLPQHNCFLTQQQRQQKPTINNTAISSLLPNSHLAGKEYILKDDKLRERMRLKGRIECTFYRLLISSDVFACLEEKVNGVMSLSKETII